MVQQSVFPFKLKMTEEKMTARSGLVFYAELMGAMGVDGLIARYMPQPGSGHSYHAASYIKSLSMMLYGGGEVIEELREIREDHSLRRLAGLEVVPSSSAMGDWLRRMGERGGIEAMGIINTLIVGEVLRRDSRESYTLIVDPTIIESGKRDAQMTYEGYRGYRPVVATLKEPGLVIAYEFKEGNDMGGRVDIIKKAFDKMPRGKKITGVLLDSEYYSDELMDYLDQSGADWIIGADKYRSTIDAIKRIPAGEWKPLKTRDGIGTDREVAETVHVTNKGRRAFRLVVLRWQGMQGELFHDDYCYHCMVTNILEGEAEAVVWKYQHRAYIENHIKEIKSGFGMERMPSGDFKANAVHFAIGIMTYNLFLAQKLLTMPARWKDKTIKSIRWLLVEAAGKLIEHSRATILKIASGIEKYRIYLEIRKRTYELLID
jgi:hypothetical protein